MKTLLTFLQISERRSGWNQIQVIWVTQDMLWPRVVEYDIVIIAWLLTCEVFLSSSIYLISISISVSVNVSISISINIIFLLKGKKPWPGRTYANTLPLNE